MCIEDGCEVTANFNKKGESKAIYCKQHKKEGMINVNAKRCIYNGCETHASYNIVGKKAEFCAKHKTEEMVNVSNKFCIYSGCKKMPSYNKPGQRKRLYCAEHKTEDMILLKKATMKRECVYKDCSKYASFNKINKKPKYCNQHKKEGMIYVLLPKCNYDGCLSSARYNNINEIKPKYCSQHKLHNMINLLASKCIHKDCQIKASFNIIGKTRPLYCSNHRLPNMIDVRQKSCKNEWCYKRASYKCEDYCLFCYINMYPDNKISKNYKTKEKTITDYIKSVFPNLSWIADKKIQDGCSKRRPDLLLDLGYQVIIIEIDENQHNNYDCSCENKRIMELSQDVGHRSIIFIRFNPDAYNKGDTKFTSCWNINSKGYCVVKKTKIKEWNERLTSLKLQIDYWTNPKNKTDKIIEIIQLFYDC